MLASELYASTGAEVKFASECEFARARAVPDNQDRQDVNDSEKTHCGIAVEHVLSQTVSG